MMLNCTRRGEFDMCSVLANLFKSYGNLFSKVKVDYRELTDEEQWEEIARSFKY